MMFTRLEELAAEDRELVRTLVGMYMEQAPEFMRNIEAALAKKDGLLAKQEAHTLKGVSLNMGLDDVAATCKNLDEAAVQEDFAQAAVLLQQLRTELATTLTELERFL